MNVPVGGGLRVTDKGAPWQTGNAGTKQEQYVHKTELNCGVLRDKYEDFRCWMSSRPQKNSTSDLEPWI